ncbi:SAM-dependent methyltransferase [Streptomyces sp. DT24]|uniref:SAM-dependent methyltransferase n=1 Tax=Streptomyces sp. DT24 TaxID=3416520 RepID=UPI003CFB0EFD
MTPALVRTHPAPLPPRPGHRADDWATTQEPMLAPLYEAVYDRLEVGAGTRLLGLGCGSGLALLIAAGRGARVTGLDTDRERPALARGRLLPGPVPSGTEATSTETTGGADPTGAARITTAPGSGPVRLSSAAPATTAPAGEGPHPAHHPDRLCAAEEPPALMSALRSAVPLVARGGAVVLTGWGPPERCATADALRMAHRLAAPRRSSRPGRDDLEKVAHRAGLRPDGSGRVSCPFGYPDLDRAVRGLLSTGLFDAAIRVTDPARVERELLTSLSPHLRSDGTVRMPNVFRHLVCRV